MVFHENNQSFNHEIDDICEYILTLDQWFFDTGITDAGKKAGDILNCNWKGNMQLS